MTVEEAAKVVQDYLSANEIELNGEKWDFTFSLRRVTPNASGGLDVTYALEDDAYDETNKDEPSELTMQILNKGLADLKAAKPDVAGFAMEIKHFKN